MQSPFVTQQLFGDYTATVRDCTLTFGDCVEVLRDHTAVFDCFVTALSPVTIESLFTQHLGDTSANAACSELLDGNAQLFGISSMWYTLIPLFRLHCPVLQGRRNAGHRV